MKDKIKKLKKLKETANNKDDAEEYERKIKEYYDERVAFYDSWTKSLISNRVEKDKQLLALSALAVGFLVTFFSDINSVFNFFVWLLSTILFIISGIIIYSIFSINADYIEVMLDKHHAEGKKENKFTIKAKEKSKQLDTMTKWATWIFLAGIIFTILLAILESELITTLLKSKNE